MVGSRLLYFGLDLCYRLPVIRNAGYRIDECTRLPEFSSALATDPDAVLLEAATPALLEQAIVIARSECTAPLILFTSETTPAVPVDLVIPSLTVPEHWLHEIETVIERFRESQKGIKKTGQMSTSGYAKAAGVPKGSRKAGALEEMPQQTWRQRQSG